MIHVKPIYIQRILGGLYVFAGIGKFLKQPESVEGVLARARMANQNNWLTRPTGWMAVHHVLMMYFVALAMIIAGIVLLINRLAVRAALYGTLLMLTCFMLFLHKSQPVVFLTDLPFVAAAIYLLNKQK